MDDEMMNDTNESQSRYEEAKMNNDMLIDVFEKFSEEEKLAVSNYIEEFVAIKDNFMADAHDGINKLGDITLLLNALDLLMSRVGKDQAENYRKINEMINTKGNIRKTRMNADGEYIEEPVKEDELLEQAEHAEMEADAYLEQFADGPMSYLSDDKKEALVQCYNMMCESYDELLEDAGGKPTVYMKLMKTYMGAMFFVRDVWVMEQEDLIKTVMGLEDDEADSEQ